MVLLHLLSCLPPEAWGKQQPPFTKDSHKWDEDYSHAHYGLVEMSSELCFVKGLNYVYQRCSLLNEQTDLGWSN